MTVDEAAAYLGIWPTLVRRYIQQGRLPGRKFSRIWMLARADVEAFAKQPRPAGVHRTPRTPETPREAPEAG